jgi:hypothetical protein
VNTKVIKNKTSTNLADRTQKAFKKLFFKVLIYSEAYIFVLEGSTESNSRLKALSETQEDPKKIAIDPNTIHASYVRLNGLLHEHEMSASEYFRSVLFVDLISSTEVYFSELIKAVVAEHPQKLGRTQFELKDIIEAGAMSDLIQRAADEYIYKLMYEKPEDYLAKICDTLSIDPEIIKPLWPSYIEAKARRDVGVHNNWICNKTYLKKLASQKSPTNAKEGINLTPKDRHYCGQVSDNILEICRKMMTAVIEKYCTNEKS